MNGETVSAPEFTIEYLDPRDLKAHPQNWRGHPEIQRDALRESLSEFGYLAAPIWNRASGHILDGHARVELAVASEDRLIPVRVIDVPAAQEKRILASFDRIGELRERDDLALTVLLQELAQTEDGLPAGWGEDDLAALIAELEPESGLVAGADPDAIPEKIETRCKAGDLWELGDHRLICCDSADIGEQRRMLAGMRVAAIITSPPYNQKIDQFRASGMHKEHDWVSKIERLAYQDSLPEDEYQAAQRAMLGIWHDLLSDGASIFYNHKNRYRDKSVVSPMEWLPGPFRLRQEIIWSRPGSVTQNARMFLPSDERIYWMYKGADFYFDDTTEIKTYSSVWDIAPSVNKTHAVAFPVEIPTRCVRASTRPTDIVMDPYAGSGTTMMACEALGRAARLSEIDPHNCDVILARWEAATGREAVRLE